MHPLTGKKQTAEHIRKRSLALIGHKLSDEHRRKIGLSNRVSMLGRKFSLETRMKISLSLRGKKPSMETRIKMSEAGKKRKATPEARRNMSEALKGKKCYLWKGGITAKQMEVRNNVDTKLWRDSVFKRDRWTCQICRKTGRMNAHHIYNFSQYPELRFDVSNGITLCGVCHLDFHRVYGYSNNNQDQLNEMLNENKEISGRFKKG